MEKEKHSGSGRGVTFLFLGFLGVLSLLSIVTPQKAFSDSENRYLQKKPEFSVKSLMNGSYGKKYEKYLSDQFPGRNVWIGMKVTTERLALQEDVNGVYFGKDGYLIEKFDTEDLEGEQLNKNIGKLAAFTGAAEKSLGKDHVRVMLVPSASQIMTERLPFLAAPYDQGRVTGMLCRSLKEAGGSRETVLPAEEYLKRYREEALYYRTDHHWTARGAYLGYRLWAESVGLTPWTEEMFDIQTVNSEFHGTVYSKLNVPWRYDTIEVWQPKEEKDYRVYFDSEPKEYDSLYFPGALEGKDKYAVYLDGNHAITKIENRSITGNQREKKLLMIKDSYAHSFAVFAANHFGTVYMADLRYLNLNLKEWMEEQEITDVLVLYQIPGFAKEKSVSKLVYDR
ncbi:MAG: DHHW family protein [Hungatella hathewayi]|uniref:DHHW family protein n=1 Tax=Hungatella TaxID=1649459 RepID=UPI001106B691|nr:MULTISPECIES: DHHW family protein [Hungatella]MCI7384975.1 DHHW family protein [Hungatella sp.]MDY6237208.1 DHHW family protein [Hungatella hathewayi]